LDAWAFYSLAKRIDCFVLLTRFMAERLGVDERHYVVVEGIAAELLDDPVIEEGARDKRCVFLYSGTLAARYGVMTLIEAFSRLPVTIAAELWICGDGDSRNRIQEAARNDARISYLGQLSRSEVRQLQRRATVLVNPRPAAGEYTRYSFPSKTLEYMVSGRPVLMYRLPGVPDEYFEYVICPKSNDVDGLATALRDLSEMTPGELDAIGATGREFALREKNAAAQCRKVLDLLSRTS
jgi:glycosyltransferase involved in cell wall biosynthesis